MQRSKFIQNLAARTGYTKENIERVMSAFQDEITDLYINGDKLMLKGFMIFETVYRPPHRGKHPITDKIVEYPESKTAKARVSKEIKRRIK